MGSHNEGDDEGGNAFLGSQGGAAEIGRDGGETPDGIPGHEAPQEDLRGALSALRRRYETILASAAEGICGLDLEGRIAFVNPAAAAILGRPEADLIGSDFHAEFHCPSTDPSSDTREDCPVKLAVASLRSLCPIEDRLRRDDGTVFPVELCCSPIVENDVCFGAVVTFFDISSRKRFEKSSSENEDRFRLLFKEMLDGCALNEIVCDESGAPVDFRFLEVNPAFERITGLDRADVVGATAHEVFPQLEPEWIVRYGHVALGGEPCHFERFSIDLNKHFEESVFSPRKGRFALTFTDITERRRAEEEKRRVEAHLRQTQKLEAIGTLAGGIAHDFNNILLAVLGHCELAMLDIDESSATYNSLREVVRAAGHAKELAHQILTFSRQVERERIPVQVATLVSETVRLLRSTIPATIEIREFLNTSATILAEPTQVHQIVMNLCTNAYHAMRETGGVLEISIEDVVPGSNLIALHPGLKRSPYVVVSVRDTGQGISRAVIERLFEPFFTTKEVGEGTGLGLSTVHGIVKDLGGEIVVQSEEGQGSVFTVYLPRHEETAQPSLLKSRETLRGAGERILFVDDEPAIALLAGRMLASLGYNATVCERSREALEKFQADPAAFDLVITDMIMPDLSGERLIAAIREIRPDVPFLLVTGYNDAFTDKKALHIGIKHYLLKPFASRDLGLAIRTALESDARRGKNVQA